MNSILEFQNVKKIIEGKPILKNISFVVPERKIVAFLGPNGAGKTTTLKIAAGLLEHESGQIIINENEKSLYKSTNPEIGRAHV